MRRSLTRRLLGPIVLTGAAVLGVYVWRRWGYAVVAEEREVPYVPEGPIDDVPEAFGRAEVQRTEDGVGPRFHRRYEVDVAASTHTPEALMREIAADIQAFVPGEIARFERTAGEEGALAVGDEFHIHITSPWDGPVRVAESEPTCFVLATLEGHLEAGQIQFEAAGHPSVPGALRFSIESWARSRDKAVDLAYDKLGVAKQAQQGMWTFFCERVVEACGGERIGEIRVTTEREARDV